MRSLYLDFTGIQLTNDFFRGVIFVASALPSLQRLSVILEGAAGCCVHIIASVAKATTRPGPS